MATIGLQEGWNMLISMLDTINYWLITLTIWNTIITGILVYILFANAKDSKSELNETEKKQ